PRRDFDSGTVGNECCDCADPPGRSTPPHRPAESVVIMSLQGPATRMTIYLNDGDRIGRKALFSEIVHRAHAYGLAGASVLHGIEGFGIGRFVHTDRLLDRGDGLP